MALAEARRAIDAELGQVRILDGGSITLSSQTGRFPLTVVNDLTVPVTVQLTLASRTPARLRVPSITGIEVAPGARTTVDVSAEANANGEYLVDARLATLERRDVRLGHHAHDPGDGLRHGGLDRHGRRRGVARDRVGPPHRSAGSGRLAVRPPHPPAPAVKP